MRPTAASTTIIEIAKRGACSNASETWQLSRAGIFGIDKTQNFRTIDATFDEGGLYFRITSDNTTPAIDGILARQPDGVHRGYVLTNTSCGAVYLWWEATVR